MNFWRPSDKANFKALGQNELFLFTLHFPDNYIVGGGTEEQDCAIAEYVVSVFDEAVNN